MARIRTIKPDFWTDSKTGTLSGDATKLFIGMLNFSDDYGVLEYDMEALKAKIFPYSQGKTPKIIGQPLDELLTKGLIIIFEWDEQSFFWIRNFEKHQKVDKPGKPLIEGFTSVKLLETLRNQKSVLGFGEHSANSSENSPCNVREGKVKERKGKEILTCVFENFEKFWELYPKRNGKKIGKAEAERLFAKITDGDIELILQAVRNYASSTGCRNGYAKDAIRFLRNDFWRDWIEPEISKEEERERRILESLR